MNNEPSGTSYDLNAALFFQSKIFMDKSLLLAVDILVELVTPNEWATFTTDTYKYKTKQLILLYFM